MTNISFYGGVGEVGGNKILLKDGKSKIFFDFGMSFSQAGRFFDVFLQPRKLNGLGDWIEMGLLPPVNGIYRNDYLRQMGAPEESLDCQGVFISHAHADHASYVHHLHPDLPIYGTAETLKIMESVQQTSLTGTNELTEFVRSFEFYNNKRDGVSRLQGQDARLPRVKQSIDKKMTFGDLEVEAVRVNHSLLGACGYIVETPDGKIAYTGDLRFHGYGGHLTEQFIRRAEDADYLVMEGTRINSKDHSMTEAELCAKMAQLIGECKGLVMINWPARDTDRLQSVFTAARKNDRKLVLSTKQAHLLDKLAECGADVPSTNDTDIRIFLTRKSWGLITKKGASKEQIEQDYATWERPYIVHKNTITFKDLQDSPKDYVVRCDLFDMTELIDIQPPKGSLFIQSVCEPFDDEMQIDRDRLDNWLKHFNLYPAVHLHCSGHAPGPDLKRIIDEIQPGCIIPIHTDHPEMFKGLAKKVIEPEVGKEIKILR